MYIYIYIFTCIHTYTNICIYIHTRTHICMYIFLLYSCIHAFLYVPIVRRFVCAAVLQTRDGADLMVHAWHEDPAIMRECRRGGFLRK